MTMTLNISDEVLRALERRAQRENRSIDESAEHLLRKSLQDEFEPEQPLPPAVLTTDPATGLPIVRGDPNAPVVRMTREEFVNLISCAEEEAELDRYFASLRR